MEDQWNIIYDKYEPEHESLREALCTLGNGYFATRGAAEESIDDKYHYPGTYLAGGYNRLKSEIKGKVIENEDLVNWPNWLLMKMKTNGGDWINLDQVKIKDFKQEVDLKSGVLKRKIHIVDNEEKETIIQCTRLVHMNFKHLAAISWEVKPVNWSGNITIHSAIDGSVINNGVERYSDLNSQHLSVLDKGRFDEEGIYLQVETKQSEIKMAQAARTLVRFEGDHFPVERKNVDEKDYIAQELYFPVKKNSKVTVEKTVAIYTSRDNALSDTISEAKEAIIRALPFDELSQSHSEKWKEIWDRVDTQIVCDNPEEQLILRLHIFHLFQTASFNTIDLDVGIPSRGWHGEAYRGHILWDELFIFPFINFSVPELTRSLLMYRYRRLPEARCYAGKSGYKGAMFPWQSGSNGREESQEIHLNPQSGNWIPDNTFLQRHVSCAIAFNVWQYFQVSADYEFLSFYGAEMMLDIAHFWATKATWDDEKEKYVINNVVGPDEYHTSYPDSDEPGLNNNAYTNVMVVWTLKHALETIKLLDKSRREELFTHLKITREDLERWDKISRNIYIPFINEKVISQFDGFENLEELDWDKYHEKYGEILRLDRILEKENDNVNKYKAAKQADVMMLFYLLSSDELTELIQRNGYDFSPEYLQDNITYYQKITSHGSTLSKLVYSWVLVRSDRSHSWRNFQKALMSDFKDIQGGTTSEGIHLGAMAGTVDLIQRCYTGLEIRDNALWFNPRLPDELKRINFNLRYRGHWVNVDVTDASLKLKCAGGWSSSPIKLMIGNKEDTLNLGDEKEFQFENDMTEMQSR